MIKEKDLGKQISTEYHYGSYSIKVYEKGYRLKMIKQEPVFIDKITAMNLAYLMRDNKTLHTLDEASKILAEATANGL